MGNENLHIRMATIRDARSISYLIIKNTEKVKENKYTMAQIKTWKLANSPKAIRAQLDKRDIFCAFQNSRLVGTIGLQGNEVVGAYVSYSKIGKGIGKKLIHQIEGFARTNGIHKLELTSTPSALKFYISNGYQQKEPVTLQINGVDFMETRMTKMLTKVSKSMEHET